MTWLYGTTAVPHIQYNEDMNFLRRTVYHGAGVFFTSLLALTPFVFAVAIALSNPDTIRGIIKDSGVYQHYPQIALDHAVEEAKDPSSKQVLSDPAAQQAITSALPANMLESSVGSFIDGLYGWLEGKTPEPQFSIDLSQAKQGIAANLAAYAENRAAGLQPCTYAQLRTLGPNSDPLSLPCLPPGVTKAQIGQQVSQQLTSNTGFIEDPVVSNDTIKQANNGKSLVDGLDALPKAYRGVQASKWILLGLILGLGAALVLARRDRLAGLRYVGLSALTTGLLVGLGVVAFLLFFGQISSNSPEPGPVEQITFNGIKALLGELNKVIGIFAGVYIVGGIGMLIALHRLGGSIRIAKG